MKMKLVDACLSLCLTRLIFPSIFESAHASRVLAEASRLGELCVWSRRNLRQLKNENEPNSGTVRNE